MAPDSSSIEWTAKPSMAIPVSNDELMTVRDAMRSLNRVVDGLSGGPEPTKAVLTSRGKMVAVVLAVDEYRNLLAGQHDRR